VEAVPLVLMEVHLLLVLLLLLLVEAQEDHMGAMPLNLGVPVAAETTTADQLAVVAQVGKAMLVEIQFLVEAVVVAELVLLA
jgi:hypothetical protein